MCDANLDAIEQVVSGCIIRPVQSEAEAHYIRRTMALEYQTAQTQQGSAVVSTMVNPIFKSV
jgi:hypothetical protein